MSWPPALTSSVGRVSSLALNVTPTLLRNHGSHNFKVFLNFLPLHFTFFMTLKKKARRKAAPPKRKGEPQHHPTDEEEEEEGITTQKETGPRPCQWLCWFFLAPLGVGLFLALPLVMLVFFCGGLSSGVGRCLPPLGWFLLSLCGWCCLLLVVGGGAFLPLPFLIGAASLPLPFGWWCFSSSPIFCGAVFFFGWKRTRKAAPPEKSTTQRRRVKGSPSERDEVWANSS